MMPKRELLVISSDGVLHGTQRWMLEGAGYSVIEARGFVDALTKIRNGSFRLMVLGKVMPVQQIGELRKQLLAITPPARVIGIHGRGRHIGEDVSLDALTSPENLLRTVGEQWMQTHSHEEVRSPYAAYVDNDRRFIQLTAGLCQLLGRAQEELLGKKIEDISAPQRAEVKSLFQNYAQAGEQAGVFVLKHKSGAEIPVRYQARVLQDGCLVSEMEPFSS